MKSLDNWCNGFVNLPARSPFCAELNKSNTMTLCGLASCTLGERTCFRTTKAILAKANIDKFIYKYHIFFHL